MSPSDGPSTPYRVVLIGCGAVSEILYRGALLQLESEGLLTVVALVDPGEARTAVLGKAFRAARRFDNLDAALEAGPADIAIVATPARLHREHTLAALRHGCHVLCEKPFALTAAECDDMIEEARRLDRVLGVGHFRRFYPSAQAIRSLVRSGVLGRPVSFSVSDGGIFQWPWRSEVAGGGTTFGGVLGDIGPHVLDLLTWWLGPLRLESYEDDALGLAEVNCRLALSSQSGARGTVLLSRDTMVPARSVIECERGWVAYSGDDTTRFTWGWEGAPFAMTVHLASPAQLPPMLLEPDRSPGLLPDLPVYFTDQLRNLCAAIGRGDELLVSVEDARDCIRLIGECYSSRNLLEMPWLDEESRARVAALVRSDR